jgi:exonuclease VII small subunit
MPSQKISQFPAQTTVASGDILALVTVSGSTFDNKRIGIDVLDGRYHATASGGAALEIAVEALASGNAALTDSLEALASGNAGIADAATALASGNAALTDVGGKYDKTGGPISGTVRVQAQSYSDVRDEGLESGTITLDFGSSNNFKMTLTGTSTLGAPTNASGGQSGSIFILQDGTGSRTLAYNAVFAFAGGTAPTLTTAASGQDALLYYVQDASTIITTSVLNV